MLFSRRKPGWLHDSLPALCLVSGIAAVWSLHDTLGLASGALLFAAALSSLLRRRLERRAQMRALLTQHSSFVPAPSRLAATTDLPTGAPALRCQLGQPVACGSRDGVPVSALRLCLSARLIVEALADDGARAPQVIARALATLDKATALAATVHAPTELHHA